MVQNSVYIRKAMLNAPVEFVFNWHSHPGAIEMMTPPWVDIHLKKRTGGLKKGAHVVLKMRKGPFSFVWDVIHVDYRENSLFVDRQIRGPFAFWEHSHKFTAEGDALSGIVDHLEYRLPLHPVSSFLTGRYIKKDLDKIFKYRQKKLANDIEQQFKWKRKPMNILISGSNGNIASHLIPFLTTAGHHVIRLVRKAPIKTGEIFWDPHQGVIQMDKSVKIDAVIHLAGENIGDSRWNELKKRKILESRVKGTEILVNALEKLDPKPEAMICASATGYYGNTEDRVVTESDGKGNHFVSKVCAEWEKAASKAENLGIRTVIIRIGVVLTPDGGALERLLFPFRLGCGGKIGSGKQYMSWISIDDLVGAFFHALVNESVTGPINGVAPNPVTNLEFTKTLGKVLHRPTFCTIPPFALNLAFGEMSKELLLTGVRAKPEKLLQTGYEFRHVYLEDALRYLLGKNG